ncbi:MAG TPA: DinB family protein [Rudaea sp.]
MRELRKLVRYKAWANALLFPAVAQLPEHALTDPQPLIFGNLIRTLNHTYAMDYVWQSYLRGQPHGLTTRNPDDCPSLPDLAQAQRAMDAWYVDYADELDPQAAEETIEFTFIGGGPGALTRGEILLHVVNHGTYHRGHVAAMMNQYSARAPITDLPVFLRQQREVR